MIPPLTKPGSPIDFGARLADGVLGYAIESDGIIWIPDIRAEVEGDGRVGKFIDALDRDRTIRFPTVIGARLAGMLVRRGFAIGAMLDDDIGEVVEFYERAKTTSVQPVQIKVADLRCGDRVTLDMRERAPGGVYQCKVVAIAHENFDERSVPYYVITVRADDHALPDDTPLNGPMITHHLRGVS